MMMKPLSERMREWDIMEFYNVRKVVDKWADEVAQLEAELAKAKEQLRLTNVFCMMDKTELAEARRENERLREIKLFCHAEAQTLCDGRDFSLAAYMLKDLEITQSAGLVDLCYAMSKETASKGDWEGLKQWWLEAALKAGDDDAKEVLG